MKAKGILIASVATVLGIGTVAHLSGHAPKCPLGGLFKHAKHPVKKEATVSVQADAKPNSKTVAMMNAEQKLGEKR